MPTLSPQQEKIRDFLKTHAPFSVIDRGIDYANEGFVSECSRTGNLISGSVLDLEGNDLSVQLEILSGNGVEATCHCSTKEELLEQWCPHVVALLWRASELDFFDTSQGFASQESTIRMNTNSPADMADVLREIRGVSGAQLTEAGYRPSVGIELDLRSDRLGVRLFFDGELQSSNIFGGFSPRSSRELDNVLLQLVDEEGSWDQNRKLWYINSSKGIESVLGLLEEFDSVVQVPDRTPVNIRHDLLSAQLSVEWLGTSAELVLNWILPDGSRSPKNGELLGTGPFWAVIKDDIYRVSPSAARLAALFPFASTMTLSNAQAGPLLEVITREEFDEQWVNIVNPELQPKTEVVAPTPLLELFRKDGASEHFGSGNIFEIVATLEFEYPAPSSRSRKVYLPDREKEEEFRSHLRGLGFHYSHNKKQFQLLGDSALDLLHQGETLFPEPWKILGLSTIKKGLRFAELDLNISISQHQKSRSGKGSKKSASSGPIDWFDCHVSLLQNNANVPLSLLFKNMRSESDRWIKLDSGAFARVPGGGLKQLGTTLGILDPNFRLSNTIRTEVSTAQAISFVRSDDEQLRIDLDRELQKIASRLESFENIEIIEPSKKFEGKLRPYQRDGLSWLVFLNDYGLDGILADEMGLGKTVQTLALLSYLRGKKLKKGQKRRPHLVIAPTSVITNWSYECRRFTPELTSLVLHGPGRKKHFETIENVDIVITSYALLRMDRFELEKIEWGHLILDEAQNIKNPSAATTRAAKALPSTRRLALTGTPTENRPMELWSILDFLMPGYLGSKEYFKNHIEKPILEHENSSTALSFLKTKTRPFILRREKAEVERDLPPKMESVVPVPMVPAQRELYSQILEEVRPKVFDAVEERGVSGASVSILAALLRLRQVCNHPNSIDALKTLPDFGSGKFDLLKELVLEAIESGRKILLFSQFREMLAIIRRWLQEQSFEHLYLDGSTKDRQALVDRFNEDESVRLFLISLKAGGTGLNLTAADTVIIYDPWWNPAVEGQAVDRAHRIGQKKRVSVYRLVTEHSIEQKIMDLKRRKARIVDALINENGLSTLKLTRADLENFFAPLPTDDEALESEQSTTKKKASKKKAASKSKR